MSHSNTCRELKLRLNLRPPSDACSIELEDRVVVTGGSYTPASSDRPHAHGRVAVYSAGGGAEEWPGLATPRLQHGCGHYVSGDSRVVARS